MAITPRQMLVQSNKYNIKCPHTMNPEFITVHNTWNDATANNEISYMRNNNNQVSFHYAIDDVEIVQGIPENRNAWHCGDGNGNGNRKSIGIEICFSKSGGERYKKAENLAILFIAQLLHKKGWDISRVKKHQDWSKKYCPHRILSEGRWDSFLKQIAAELVKLKQPTKTKLAVVIVDSLNVRKGPSTNHEIVDVVHRGDAFTVVDEINGWFKLKSGLFISASPKYVQIKWK